MTVRKKTQCVAPCWKKASEMCKQENSDVIVESCNIYKVRSEGSGQSELNAQIVFNVENMTLSHKTQWFCLHKLRHETTSF